ncbi:MAG: T9SS type A sorting domain-containing protein [Bacteroidota bacterium]|nr:T9SS type A sorting domain-containing protein [Bacteroidota bacterium]
MKKIYLLLLLVFVISGANATLYIIVPTVGGGAYTPSFVTVAVGDVVQFGNSTTYPCAQVSQATWLANGTTTLAGGFGVQTSSYSFTVTASTGTVYFVCTTKVASNGTKGIVQLGTPSGLTTNYSILQNISLFPNPATDKINITVPPELENVTLKLFALNGQELDVVAEKDLSNTTNSFSLNFSPMISTGVYFLEVVSGSERIYKKIVISK